MTINSTIRKAGPFIGNGATTTFPFGFKVFAAGDVLAVKLTVSTNVQTTLVLNTDYTVTLNQDQDSNPGGSITLIAGALASGYTLTMTSDVENLQPTDLTNQGGFYPDVINDALDRATIQIQQIQTEVDSSLRLPLSSTASTELPNPDANQLIGWNSTGDGLTNIDPGTLASIVAYSTAYADTFTGNGSTVNWTLTRNPGTLYNLDISTNGVTQVPTADYTLSGTTLTTTSAAPLGSVILVKYKEGLPNTSGDSQDFRYLPAGTGAVQTTVQAKLRQYVSVKDFGAVGDGIANDTAAIVTAVAACQAASQTSLYFPAGIYKIQSTIVLGAASTRGIAFVGETAAPQQGSDRPAVTFRWYGGSAAMFDIQYTYFRFYNIAFENFTTATDAFFLTSAMHMVFDNCSFVIGNGATRFSRSVIHCDGNEFGYSIVQNCEISSPAPRFLNIDGATSNGITPVLFYNNIIESNSAGAITIVYVKNEGIDILTFQANTINGQANAQLTLVDTTDTPLSETITVLNVYDNEFDLVSNTSTDRMFRLTNVANANFWGNQYQGGGAPLACADLVNSVVTQFSGNYLSSCAGPFFNADAISRVYSQANNIFTPNTKGIVNDSASTSGMIQMTYGSIVTILGERGVGTGHTVFRVDVSNTAGFTLTFEHPGIGGQGYMVRGQVLSVQVRNMSGGVIPSITLAGGATYWSLSGGAFPIPANGNSRTVTFVWSGSKLVEIGRTAADVPN